MLMPVATATRRIVWRTTSVSVAIWKLMVPPWSDRP
jgi:hypothetical protein